LIQDCYFACEYHGGYIALRDSQGLYLAPIGSRAILKTRSQTVTKDELFSLEDSLPQASFVAASNARYVSVKQGKSNNESRSVRVARFFLVQHTKAGKNTKLSYNVTNKHIIYPMVTKYTKWPQNIPNDCKIYQHLPLHVPPKFTQI
jgi:hypothetical protein